MTAVLARWWHVSGLVADLVGLPEVGDSRPLLLVDGEPEPRRTPFEGWCMAPTCEFCDEPARFKLRYGTPDDLLCGDCSLAQYGRSWDWVKPIEPMMVRRWYPAVAETKIPRLWDQFIAA